MNGTISGPSATAGLRVAQQNRQKSMGYSLKKKPMSDPSRKYNIDKIRETGAHKGTGEFHYKPKVSQDFLAEWLDFPVDTNFPVFLNTQKMWLTWLLWTNRAIAGLDPNDTTIRSRVCSQISVLGTAAGLFLVIAIAGFLVPPQAAKDGDDFYINLFGCAMFTSSVCLIFYIGLALTGFYPLVESLRDDVAFDAFENYQKRVGSAEVYLFFIGLHLVLVALLLAAKVLYDDIALYFMLGMTVFLSGVLMHLSRQIFLALDPISSMHMGLSNDPEQHYRAELMSHFILRKVPNSLLQNADSEGENDHFQHRRESLKYQETVESQRRAAVAALGNAAADGAEGVARGVPAASDGQPTVGVKGDGEMEVIDLERSTVAKASHQDAPNKHDDAAHVPAAENTVGNKNEAATHTGASSLPALQEMFCHPTQYYFRSEGVQLADSTAAYESLQRAGCGSTEELLRYLSETKRHQACSCGARFNSSGGGSVVSGGVDAGHSADCASRSAGVWMEGLVAVGIPHFTAMKIVLALRAHL